MARGTAVSANSENARTITFKNKEHEKFYKEYLSKCRYQDVYHKALVYCLGISEDTRNHVQSIYDFKTGCVKTKCLHDGWQTSGSVKIIRMAFNLYCNGTPSVFDYEDVEQLASTEIWRSYMLKIRLQGTTNYIKWFKKILERDKRINVLDVSEAFANKGKNQRCSN